MNTAKQIIFILLLLKITFAFSQIESGRLLFSGNTFMNHQSEKSNQYYITKTRSFNFSPEAGIMLSNNVAMGMKFLAQTGYFKSSGLIVESTSFEFSPYLRLYITELSDGIYPYVEGSAGIGIRKSTNSDLSHSYFNSTNSDLVTFRGGAGVAIQLVKSVYLNVFTAYARTKIKDDPSRSNSASIKGFSTSMGVLIVI